MIIKITSGTEFSLKFSCTEQLYNTCEKRPKGSSIMVLNENRLSLSLRYTHLQDLKLVGWLVVGFKADCLTGNLVYGRDDLRGGVSKGF